MSDTYNFMNVFVEYATALLNNDDTYNFMNVSNWYDQPNFKSSYLNYARVTTFFY